MSGGIRVRRVADPLPIQRGPPPQSSNFDDLTTAWNNHAEANSALQRAEARLEEAETYHPGPFNMDSDPRGVLSPGYKRYLDGMEDLGSVRVPVDRVPTVEFGGVQHSQISKNRVSRAKYGKDRARKRVTIVDNFEWDKPSLHPALSPTRNDRDLTRNPNSLSPSRNIDNNQIQRLENQLKSLSHTLKSSAYDGKTIRSSSPRRGNYMYEDLPADRNWTNGSSHLESFERRTSPKGNAPSPSSQEILSRGSANLSVDNSTAIRVLNDLPSSQHPSEKERNQRNHEFREDYVPAYERIYGTQPMEKLSNRQEQNDDEFRQSEAVRQRIRASRKLAAGSSASSHMDRLREKVEEQKAAVTLKEDGLDRVWHREADPVILQDPDGGQNAFPDFSVQAGKSTVRKVAAAPAAPAYRGFSEVETRFKMPDGKILTEEKLLLQKTTGKNQSHRNRTVNQNVRNASDRALKPSLALHQQNRREQNSKPSRTVRKVHKASKALERRPKRPERKDIISTTSWRDGQKTVLKILGPPEKPASVPKTSAPHSPPTHDTEEPPSPRSLDLVTDMKTKDDISDAELSEHPLEPEELIEEIKDNRPGPSLDMNNLPSEAKNVLEDLNLSPSDSEDETSQPEKQRRKRESQPPPKSFKKNRSAKVSQQDTEQILPADRVRHYDTDNVRKYMAKQKADRRRKLQEEKKERKLAQDRKQEQLRELSKKQKESVRTCQRTRDTTNSQLGETFSKGPVGQAGGQLNGFDPLPRHHPFRQDGKKIDVTSSDKENKNIWSTSSSDSSTQSNVLSDTPHSPSELIQPPPQLDHLGRLSDMTESQGQPPRQSSPIGVVVTQMAVGMSDGGQMPLSDPGQRTEVRQPAGVGQGLKNNAPLPPASTSVPSGISTVGRSRSDRIQALKATAAALQGKIDNEVRKLTVDIHTPVATSPGEAGRWAYPAGNKTATPGRAVHFSEIAVESPVWVDESTVKASRYQRMIGNDYNHRVFTGSLPGTSNLSAQAHQAQASHHQDQAATKIQAAFRGHSIRQRLHWNLPSGRTLGDTMRRRAPDSIPEVHVSSADRAGPLSGRGVEEDDASLSEGPLSDDVPDYMPTFKSLPIAHSHVYQSQPGTSQKEVYVSDAPLTRPTSLLGTADRWKESLADGLSVINIFTRKYQNANRAVLYGQLPDTTPSPKKGSPIGYSYNDDFTGGSSTSSKPPKTKQEEASAYIEDFSTSSKSKTRSKNNSSTTSPSSKSSYRTASSHKRSSRSEVNGQTRSRKMDDNTLDLSPNESFGSSGDDAHQRKRISRTPSPKPSPASFHTKSISDQRSSPSLLSPTASLGSKTPSSPDSTVSSGSLSRSPGAENQSGHSSGGSSKVSSGQSKTSGSKSRSKSKSSSRSSRSQGSTSSKSTHTKDGINLLKPVSSGSSVEMNGDRGVERKSSRSGLDPRPSTSGKPPLPSQYSPAALSLKMASELNLLESLEESVRQISEMERTRHVSLAQQESVSLARVLQARQRDHEREIQLLSLKARQEVEEANKQLEVVRQRAVETASDAERVLAQARREASDARSDTTRRLIESQAEAAKVTAEAAKQMAEAQRMPAQPPMPSIDPSKLATDTATAATSAAVTAALEQQRLHQIEFLKEMKGALAPLPAAVHTSSLGVGENVTLPSRQSSQLSYTSSSRSDTPHSPKPEYTDDFTESAKSVRSSHSISSGTIPEASSLSVLDQSRSGKSVKSPTNTDVIQTASSLSIGQDNSSMLIKTDSALSPVKSEYSPSIGNSSIHTASNISGGSTVRSPSISEDIPDNKQSSYSSYSSDTRSKTSSSGTTPTSSSTPIRPKEDRSKMMTTYDVRQPQVGNFTLGMDDSFTRLSAEMLKQQLRDEEVRSQQQGALFKLREKTLLEKAKVELEWLEHEKRRHKEKGDAEALQSARKRQQALVAKVQQEQAEMRRLRAAQKAASHERQLLLFQQQEILRMRKATEAVKDHMKDFSNISITSSIGGALSEDHPSNASTVASPDLPEVLSDSNISIESPGDRKGTGLRKELHGTGLNDENDGGAKASLTPAEKQAQVMQKLKKLQQPLSMKYLTKREQQLTKRRRNAEELLAWQRRLDEEESQILNMEREAMRRLDNTKPRPPMKALPPATLRDSAHESSPRLLSDDISEGSISVTPSRKDGVRDGEGQRRESGESITEDISHSSSVAEDIVTETSKKMSSSRIPTASHTSSDDTLTHTKSIPEDYTSDSFDTADHTLTPTKSILGPQRSSSSTLESFRAPLSPHRRIMESESGSESEKSFSQTVSEIASDQSDVEGRVKALEVELRKRKMEAEKLRRQQKRMQREKFKAQEASLKKQLESYDKLIEKTKAELKTESESAAKKTSVTVKPQIKQLRVSESQRLKDRSHARSLRQRTASDSSREGGAELGSMRKKRSVSEGSVSSRSSMDDEAGSGRDPSYSSFSSVFTPPTTPRLAEATTPAPLKTSTPTTKPERNSFSPPEEASDKNSISDEDSQRAIMDKKTERDVSRHRQGPQQSEDQEGQRDSSAVSDVSEDIPSAYSSASATPDEVSLKESPSLNLTREPQVTDELKGQGPPERELSEASSVPEEVLSTASSASLDSVRSTPRLLELHQQDNKRTEPQKPDHDGSLNSSGKGSPPRLPVHSIEDLSQRSELSYSSSVRTVSSHRSRTHSEQSGVSYSDEFVESSVSVGVKNKESLSDTDDDISEQLSIASEPSEVSVTSGGKLTFNLAADKGPDERTRDTPEAAPEVTISERNLDRELDDSVSEEDERTPVASPNDELMEVSQDFTGYDIGDRVIVSSKQKGTLLFKGVTHFAPGPWGGVELDEPQGTNDGSLDGHVYFHCKASHGMFVTADRLEHLTNESPRVESKQDRDSSIEEDVVSAVSERSEPEQRKQHSPVSSLSSKTPSESMQPLAQVLKSEATDEDSITEDFSEPMTDDAALARLINSAAAAVESFHEEDIKDMFPTSESAETPRGAPEQEEAPTAAKERLVDAITDQLTVDVLKDSVKTIADMKQTPEEKVTKEIDGDKTPERSSSTEKPSTTLLKMLVPDDTVKSPRDEASSREGVDDRDKEEQETRTTVIKRKIDSATETLLTDAISELISLRKRRSEKVVDELKSSELLPESPPSSPLLKSPSPDTPSASPFVRNTTPYTPDSESPVNQEETTLDDDIFINRVKVETNPFDLKDQDQVPVARPGSPVFGEPSGINPEALSERLEQMQQLGADIFEGDLFGEQEWFDDDFGSMPKSKSIIQVPVRNQDTPITTPIPGTPVPGTPVPGTPEVNRLDLTRIAQEPFYAVPHNRKEVKSLVDQAIRVFHEKALLNELTSSISPPQEIMGDDSKGSDIESTSRKSYKRLVFNLVGEAYQDITGEQEHGEQPLWMKPKRRPRKYFFNKPPRELPDIAQVVEDRALFVTGLTGRPKIDPAMNRFGKKKKDHVDEILTLELREEEQEWVDYDDDELAVKMQLTDAIFDSLLTDTAMVLNRIQDRRKARMSPVEPEIEF